MTKLTKEQIKFFIETMTDDMHNTTQHEIAETLLSKFDECESLQAKLLAYEQASKNPVAWIVHMRTGDQFTTDSDFVGLGESTHGIHSTPLYAAPVLPKQPELLSIGELLHRLEEQTGEKWVEESAQPVIPEQQTVQLAPHVYRELVNDLRDVALEYHSAQQLRERISRTLSKAVTAAHPHLAQPVSEPYKLNCWISVADRLPSEFGRYLCYVEEQNDLGKSHYQWNCSWNGDVFSDSSLTGRVTHWMPLPAAPAQESE